VQLVMNRADSGYGIRLQDVESSIGRKISHSVVADTRTVVFALNRGVPFVVAARQSRVSEDLVQMVRAVAGGHAAEQVEIPMPVPPPKKGIFQWRAH
jgi:Flp pilus assembly CpaE family ATPase